MCVCVWVRALLSSEMNFIAAEDTPIVFDQLVDGEMGPALFYAGAVMPAYQR